jgi:hypothetical protein
MTGPEHYREAERLIDRADEWLDADDEWMASLPASERVERRTADLATAQVHANLALAAAVAESGGLVRTGVLGVPTSWARAVSGEQDGGVR